MKNRSGHWNTHYQSTMTPYIGTYRVKPCSGVTTRLSATDIVSSAEKQFKRLHLNGAQFSVNSENTHRTWMCLMKKRRDE